MSNNYRDKKDERGFALVMTMAVMTGMLIIIVPLVMINNLKYTEAKVSEAEALSRYGVDSARNLTQFINQRNGGRDLSGFSQTAILPGWRDIPLLLYGSSNGRVANFVPAFLMMATPVGRVDDNNIYNGDLGQKYSVAKLHLDPGVTLANDSWFLAGGELLSANKRGLMGTLTSHRMMETIYAAPLNNLKECWVKVNGEWGQINSIRYNDDLSADLTLTNGVSIKKDDTVEFYPAKIHDKYDHNVDLDIRVRVSDERSKINVCSMTDKVADTLNINIGLDRSLPYTSPIKLRADGVNSAKIIDAMPIITSYSSPDYTAITKTGGDGIYGQREAYSGVVKVAGKRIFQHPVNMNTAPLNTLNVVFEAMKVSKPKKVARDIIDYRSGGGDNFDGNENPFDGKSGNKYFASPEAEFAELISSKFSAGDTYKILKHVYAYGDLAEYKSEGNKSVPICFTMDHVQTAYITSRVMSGKRPLIEEKATVVSREIYHDMENSTRGRVIIDSDNGWNMGMSTFYGIDWRQPQISEMNAGAKTVKFDFKYKSPSSQRRASSMVSPGLLGRVSYTHASYIKYISKMEGDKIVAVSDDLPAGTIKRLDFGLRPMSRTDHVHKIGKVTITGNNFAFSVSDVNKWNDDNVQGREFMYIPPAGAVDPEPKVISFTGTGNAYSSTTVFDADAEAGHEAYIIPRYGYDNGKKMYPDADAGQVPYYETVVIRENAVWDMLRWDTPEHGPKITKVTINGTVFNHTDNRAGGGKDIWVYWVKNLQSKGITGKYLRLRFEFEDKTNRTGKHLGGCPQLFRIIVKYTIPDAFPRRVVLDQR